MPKLTNRWAVLALMVSLRVCFGFQFQTIPPLTGFIMADLGINFTQLGLLIGLYLLPGIFIALPGGMLGARFGDKTMLVSGSLLMIMGDLLVGTSASFPPLLGGRMLGGMGGILITVQQAKIITERFSGREIATAMSILLAGYPLGIAVAMAGMGPLAAIISWRYAILTGSGFIALTLLATVLFFGNLPNSDHQASKTRPPLWHLSGSEFRLVLLAGLVWTFLNAAFIVYLGFTPALLIDQGSSVAAAGVTVSLTTWISLFTVPLGGLLADRSGRGSLLIVATTIVMSFILGGIGLGGPVLLLAMAYGLMVGPAPGTIMTLPGEVLRPASRSTGFGVFYALYYLGLSVFPPIAGWLRDRSGDVRLPLLFAAALMAMTPLALAAFRLAQARNRKHEALKSSGIHPTQG